VQVEGELEPPERTDATSPTVLITGGSAGIGLATAQRFLRAGFRVAICGRHPERLAVARHQLCLGLPATSARQADEQADEQAGRDIARQGPGETGAGRVIAFEADVGNLNDLEALHRDLARAWGRIDVLVNNAATAPLAAFPETSPSDLESVLRTNIQGPWFLTQAIWRDMARSGGGTIVNISSLAAVDPFPGFSLYGASKGWLETWTLALANEGAAVGIRVVGIRPGAVETDLLRGLFPDFPADQCVTPEQVAEAVFLAATTTALEAGKFRTVAAGVSDR
jgi:NAD(P)-dependent dehydrogenase (short-subunit alcohol dehydrogenase family)